ncbi:NTP-binding protein [Neobacillus notoginsengisoli]|uniref:NTP-binding protein n=1 Tax=Neobacillus notoginsengisoli TaxID=1578198 RepID=A0A417YRM6_9BACI|nr:AAA family ATPase [Neobacillus notoginsengisoli]RHW37298.1 NTP-binding protein [Neobacillus notoginsengisoli]
MTQFSYSRVSLFNDCPFHFDLRYIKRLTELPRYDADNPLIIGNALHTGVEHDVETAINEYYNAYPVLTDPIIEEALKLEILIPKVKAFLDKNFSDCELIHEYKIDHYDFVGYVDLIIQAPDGTCMVMDFKYSNNIKNYLESGQLHIYKDRLERDGFSVKKLAYMFVPKTSMKQKDNEDLFHFRKRLIRAVEESEVTFVPIDFDEMESVYFKNSVEKIKRTKDFSKRNVTKKCFSCIPKFAPNYLEAIYNDKGEIELVLPKNERRERKIDTKPDFWIYADSYVGKSTFVDNIPNVLFLNTDGNTDNTTAPVIPIKDIVTKSGRVTNRKLAWEVFLDAINDLETEENDYEAVALDLVEDIYEHCRVYVFDKNGWEHESDGSYGKGWSKVTTEFNNAMKRLKALGYQIGYVSKEKVEEITLKGGVKRTTFKPNINDKVANFLTGTVDLTLRAYVDSNDERFLQLKKKQNVFGGGRFDWQVETIPLEMDAFIEELKAAQDGKATKKKEKPKRTGRVKKEVAVELEDGETITATYEEEQPPAEEKPKRQHRSRTVAEEAAPAEEEKPKRERKARNADSDAAEEEKPKRTRRSRAAVADDDTPPGEDAPAEVAGEEEEKPARTRRTRREREKKS